MEGRVRWAAAAVVISAIILMMVLLQLRLFEPNADVGGSGDPLPSPPSARPVPTVAAEQLASATPMATPTAKPDETLAAVTPVAAFEVTVISAQVPANVRHAPTTEADIVGVIPIGIEATVVGKVVGEEAFVGSGIRIWYLVSAIPPNLPEEGFVYSAVVVR